jgi:hypothetical protein
MSLNNPSLFSNAYAGAFAGQLAAAGLSGTSADSTASSYAALSNVASAFATEVDNGITAQANLSASNATIVQATAAEAGTQLALPNLIFSLSYSYWQQRKGANLTSDAGATPADYATAVAAIVAQYTEAKAALTAAGSLT